MPELNWQPLVGWWPLLVLVYFVLISIPLLAISIPLAWYTGLVIPRRYGLRQETTLRWLWELGKGLFIICFQAWLLVEVAALFRAIQPQTWWAWAALVQFLYSVLKARFGPLWIHPLLSNIETLPEDELTKRLHALLARLHIPACGIFQAKVSHRVNIANAFFVGWGKGRRIILTDTLTQRLTPDEIEVILAHELGHLVHHDIWTRLAIRGLTFLGIFYFIYLYLATLTMLTSPSSLLSLVQPLLLLLFIALFLVYLRLSTRYRRRQEYQADEFALQTTQNVQAFKSAMTQITNMNLLVAAPTRRGQHPTSHPVLVKRLKHADEFAANHGISAKPA
jgi:STE24 endopeptidase